jgi:hypothetical protein
MGISIGELFVSLGFDVDDDKLKSFNDRIIAARNDILKMTGAATAAIAAIGELISGPVSHASAFKQFQDQFGFSADGLQKWARVASMVNNTLTFDQALSRYKSFAEYVQNAQIGSSGAQALSALGGNFVPGKAPEKYLDEISAFIRGGGLQKRFGANWRSYESEYLNTLGLSADYMDALNTSPGQRDSMTKGRSLSQGQIQQLDQINTKIHDIGRAYELFAQQMTVQYGPMIIKFLQDFLDKLPGIIKDIKDIVKEANALAQAIGGWKTVGELVLGWFVTKWTVGMLTSVAAVATRLLALGSGAGGVLAALATGLGGGAAVLAGGGALAAGAAIPLLLDKKFHWSQGLADWLYPPADYSGHNSAGQRVEHILPAITNHITVHSTADAHTVAKQVVDEVMRRNQQNLISTFGQLNLGAAR